MSLRSQPPPAIRPVKESPPRRPLTVISGWDWILPNDVLAFTVYPTPCGTVTLMGPKLVCSEIGWHCRAARDRTVTDPFPFSTVMGPPASSTVIPANEVLAYTSPPTSESRMELLLAVALAFPFTCRKSTLPKLVSTAADSPTVSPATEEFAAWTVRALPIRENLTRSKLVPSSAVPVTPATSTRPFWLRTVRSDLTSVTVTGPNELAMVV